MTTEPYFDSRAGKWAVSRRDGAHAGIQHFPTEHEARASVGLPGGSTDPRYQPCPEAAQLRAMAGQLERIMREHPVPTHAAIPDSLRALADRIEHPA